MNGDDYTYKRTWLSKKAGCLFFIAFIITLTAPYFITQYSVWPYLDFSNTGSIGDTIGGITAPIINLFAAFLVYLAFREQVKANEIQVTSLNNEKKQRRTESSFNVALAELNWCSKEYDEIEYDGIFGAKAIDELIRNKGKLSNPTWNIEIILMYQKVLGLRNYLDKIVTLTKNLDSKEYKAILSNKILLIHRMKSRRYRSKVLDYSKEFTEAIGTSHEEITEMLTLDKTVSDWLEGQKFTFHTTFNS